MPIGRLLISVLLFVGAAACSMAPIIGGKVSSNHLTDGSYEGKFTKFPNSARVRVIIEKGRIKRVVLLNHGSSWIGFRAEELILERILSEQSTEVDAITGATFSSRVIMNATHMAIQQAMVTEEPASAGPGE